MKTFLIIVGLIVLVVIIVRAVKIGQAIYEYNELETENEENQRRFRELSHGYGYYNVAGAYYILSRDDLIFRFEHLDALAGVGACSFTQQELRGVHREIMDISAWVWRYENRVYALVQEIKRLSFGLLDARR